MSRIALRLIRFYQRWISRFLPPMCRFAPSCSEYTRQAIEIHGLSAGVWLGIKRIARCNPFCPGGEDPVPPRRAHPAPPSSEGKA
ncbi:MAG: membrane protein insertion efficiency factor YidD [Armatimonadetes bacterium]|nr:membrane protein insertion efficiency factor YidD [Armatimonadota bacterium]